MPEEQEQAALTEDEVLDNSISEEIAESAPVEEKEVEEVKPVEEDGFQKRINKVTADKYAEKRRADELQKKLDEVSQRPKEEAKDEPSLENFDYDDSAYQAALIDYKVNKAVQDQETRAREAAHAISAQESQKVFNDRIAELNKPDFAEVANNVPELPQGVADALVQSENGAELIYHLGTHLDLADKLSGMSSNQAMMELGKISANMNTKSEIKQSAAPEPIEPITSGGGSLKKDLGEMSMEEIYNS